MGDDHRLAEIFRAPEAREQVLRRRSSVFVVNRVGHVYKIKGGRVAEDYQLKERRDHHNDTALLVL